MVIQPLLIPWHLLEVERPTIRHRLAGGVGELRFGTLQWPAAVRRDGRELQLCGHVA